MIKLGKRHMPSHVEEIITVLLEDAYGLESISVLRKIERGYINDSYEICGTKRGVPVRYCLRCYHANADERNIRFEHKLIDELDFRRFSLSPRLVRTKKGKTLATIQISNDGCSKRRYVALFHFIEGEDPYTWDTPPVDERVIAECAKAMAEYHCHIADWRPSVPTPLSGLRQMFDRMKKIFDVHFDDAEKGRTVFDRFVLKHGKDLARKLQMLNEACAAPDTCGFLRLAVHGDFHAGNLRFSQGRVVGMLDYDWAGFMPRVMDLGMALMYFCTEWDFNSLNALNIPRAKQFIRAYQETIKSGNRLPVMDSGEHRNLIHFIRFGHFIMITWAIADFYAVGADPDAYTDCIRRNQNALDWIDEKQVSGV